MHGNAKILALLVLALFALSACEQTRRALGQTKEGPDEFTVYTRAPLSLPPEYGLRPPEPGAERPQAVNPRDRAKDAILNAAGKRPEGAELRDATPAKPSRGEMAILYRTGALNATSAVRAQVDQETSFLAEEDKTLTDRIIFWGSPTEFGAAVDARRESKRIRENQAVGAPLTKGAVPTIKRRKRALLEGILD